MAWLPSRFPSELAGVLLVQETSFLTAAIVRLSMMLFFSCFTSVPEWNTTRIQRVANTCLCERFKDAGGGGCCTISTEQTNHESACEIHSHYTDRFLLMLLLTERFDFSMRKHKPLLSFTKAALNEADMLCMVLLPAGESQSSAIPETNTAQYSSRNGSKKVSTQKIPLFPPGKTTLKGHRFSISLIHCVTPCSQKYDTDATPLHNILPSSPCSALCSAVST